jgi:hypothetical protein
LSFIVEPYETFAKAYQRVKQANNINNCAISFCHHSTDEKEKNEEESLKILDYFAKYFSDRGHFEIFAITYKEIRGIIDNWYNRANENIRDLNSIFANYLYGDENVLNKQISASRKSFNCNYCDKKFHQMIHLINHSRTHTQERPFKCDICCACFSTSFILKRHATKHSEEKPFLCQTCHKSFSSKYSFKEHEKIHLDVKLHICKICNKSFAQLSTLSRHLRIHQAKV